MSTNLEILILLAAGLHLLGLVTALHATFYTRSPQGTVAWVISLVFFPYVALPLYLIFGGGHFEGYVRARRAEAARIEEIAAGLTGHREEFRSRLVDLGGALAVVESLARMPFTRGNRVRLLIDGEQTFGAIFSGIESAASYVLVQFFLVNDDHLGRELKQLLARKAGEGVRVHFLYDEIGSYGLPRSYLDELRSAGVAVHAFRTTRGRRSRWRVNFRNHRKVVVVDGRVAFVGGANVGDEYMGRDPRVGPWRDTQVLIEGPAVQGVQLSFMEDWRWSARDLPEVDWTPHPAYGAEQHVLVLPTGPADKFESCGLFFTHAIHAAQRRLWIASPYFVPDSQVVGALQLAGLRGVDVRILLPRKPDQLLVYMSGFSYFEDCEKAGVKFYRYQPGFLHQKVMLVDDAAATVGTANLDNRSFRLNFEITALVVDRGFAGQVERMLEADLARSRRVGAQDLQRRGLWFRLAVRAARLLAPIQ